MEQITTRDGRRLDVRVTGAAGDPVVVFHHGTPGAGTERRFLEQPAHARGLRMVTWSRPGYGDSTRAPGRAVVDVVADTEDVLRELGVDECLVAGASGGAPHALACAARLDGVRAALAIAGVTPFDAEGIDYTAGMGQDNVAEFGAAVAGEGDLRPYLEREREDLADVTLDALLASMATLLPPVDRAVLTGEVGHDMLTSMREALRTGVDGWLDDDLAFVAPWGFDLAEVGVPVSLWHGSEDLMVPIAHGAWLADRLPRVTAHLADDEGHLSIVVGSVGPMLDELRELGR